MYLFSSEIRWSTMFSELYQHFCRSIKKVLSMHLWILFFRLSFPDSLDYWFKIIPVKQHNVPRPFPIAMPGVKDNISVFTQLQLKGQYIINATSPGNLKIIWTQVYSFFICLFCFLNQGIKFCDNRGNKVRKIYIGPIGHVKLWR